MAWIETHDELWEHHKINRLCTAVNEPDYSVVGRLVSLWHFVLRNAWRDANLEPWGDDGIERAARWDGEKGVFVAALRECGFIDGFVVHGWQKRAGRLVQDRRRNEVRKRRRLTGGKPAVKRRDTAGKLVATLPYPTVPNLTLPNQSIPPPKNGAGSHTPPGQKERQPTEIQMIVEGWKILTGVEKGDKVWDQQFYPRHVPYAKELLNLFSGEVDTVLDCMESVYRRLAEDKGLDLSLAGVVKNSNRFRNEWLERKAKAGV